MHLVARPLYAIAITFWVGGLWAIGGIAAPSLFAMLPDRALAGAVAGRLFSGMAWIGMVCATCLLLVQVFERGWGVFKTGVFWLVLGMFALTLAGHFGIAPILAQLKADALPHQVMESVMKNRFATWHGISGVLYVVQCALGGALVVLELGRAKG